MNTNWTTLPQDAHFFSFGYYRKHENNLEFIWDGEKWVSHAFDNLSVHKSQKDFEMLLLSEQFKGNTLKDLNGKEINAGDVIVPSAKGTGFLTVLCIGHTLLLLRDKEGNEFSCSKEIYYRRCTRINPFDHLDIDDPVWVKDGVDGVWLPRHYAGDKKVFNQGLTSFTSTASNYPSMPYKYWKSDKLGEWTNY